MIFKIIQSDRIRIRPARWKLFPPRVKVIASYEEVVALSTGKKKRGKERGSKNFFHNFAQRTWNSFLSPITHCRRQFFFRKVFLLPLDGDGEGERRRKKKRKMCLHVQHIQFSFFFFFLGLGTITQWSIRQWCTHFSKSIIGLDGTGWWWRAWWRWSIDEDSQAGNKLVLYAETGFCHKLIITRTAVFQPLHSRCKHFNFWSDWAFN